MPANGIYRATVFDRTDPVGVQRVRLLVPQIYGSDPSPWALPTDPTATAPALNAQVFCMFEAGDVAWPVYFSRG